MGELPISTQQKYAAKYTHHRTMLRDKERGSAEKRRRKIPGRRRAKNKRACGEYIQN